MPYNWRQMTPEQRAEVLRLVLPRLPQRRRTPGGPGRCSPVSALPRGGRVDLCELRNATRQPGDRGYYLRALSIHGLRTRARRLASELDTGYADGQFHGRYALDGNEFHTWDGLESGYEGTFGPSFVPLYAIAVERGIVAPPTPEWWPAGG